MGFSKARVWLVIITPTYPMRLWSLKQNTTCFVLQKMRFYNPKTQPYQNVTTELLVQVTKNVKIELVLQSLTGETFEQRTANTSDDARSDISARRFWTKYHITFSDVRVFGPNAKKYGAQILHRHDINKEQEKKRQYEMRILQVENGSFTPLVLNINGVMDKEASKFYSQIAETLPEKSGEPYSTTMSWI